MREVKKTINQIKLFCLKLVNSILALLSNRYGFKKQEIAYFNSYSESLCVNNLGGAVIAMFDGRQIHCGLTDRLIGICTAYEFSKRLNLRFYILFKTPFDITNYLLPNKVNWTLNENDVVYNRNAAVPVFLNNWQSLTAFHWFYLKRIAAKNPSKQLHLYINSPFHLKQYRSNFNILFKKSPLLNISIANSIVQLGSPSFVAMAFRFAGILGDLKEDYTSFKRLDEQEQDILIKRCEKKVLQIRRDLDIRERLLITADSEKFINYIKKYDFTYVTPGGVAHIDNSHKKREDTYLKVFVDLFMLSQSRIIYQLNTGGMYKESGFARQASQLSGVRYVQVNF